MNFLTTTIVVVLTSLFLHSTTTALPILKVSVAPGGNFDLSKWELQLPTGAPGSPTTINTDDLQSSSGFQDPSHEFFFTESGDGALVMKVPGSPSSSGCVTTPNSLHCRTELREVNPSSWSPNSGNNKLTATLQVNGVEDNSVVIGQIHMDDSVSSKPVCELYYDSNGDINIGVEQTRSGGNEVLTYITNVPKGTTFTYSLEYSNNVLKATVNGVEKTLSTFSLDAPQSYFKAGNYNQGEAATDVHFYSLTVEH